MEEKKIIDIFTASGSYEYALMTTFNFDISFFERTVVNTLFEKGLRNISLFVDAKELREALSTVDYCSIGKRYVVHPVEMQGAFHPKLCLLLGQVQAKLIVASANLTASGYLRNNEIFNYFIYDADHPENLKVISAAIRFFESINSVSYQLDQDLFDEIKTLPYYGKTNQNAELFFLHNLERSILEQVHDIVRDTNEIMVAVPYYDNNLSAAKALSTQFGNSKIHLYVQDRKSRFPQSHQNDVFITSIHAFKSPRKDNPAFYHGKVYCFNTHDSSFIMYGSANCTGSALLKAFSNGGNIEAVVLEKGELGQFYPFFDAFDVVPIEELKCMPITYTGKPDANIVFRYGILDKTVNLSFGCKEVRNYKAYYGQIELIQSRRGNEILISVDPSILANQPSVFEIEFRNDHERQTVRCWFLDIDQLKVNRLREAQEVIYRPEFDNDSDRYLEDKLTILRETPITPEQLREEREAAAAAGKNNTEAEDEEDDDGIVSFIIPEAEIIQKTKRFDRLHNICHRYISSFYHAVHKHISTTKTKAQNEKPARVTTREATSNEELFQRFIARKIRELVGIPFSDKADYGRFLSYVLVLDNVFKKYTVYERVIIKDPKDKTKEKALFENDFIASSRAKMCERLLEKIEREHLQIKEEERFDTIVLSIQSILELQYLVDDSQARYLLTRQNILKKLNFLFSLRSEYLMYTVRAVEQINLLPEVIIDFNSAAKYIDGLFGYKKEEDLRKTILRDYGSKTKIEIDLTKKTIYVWSWVNQIGEYMIIRPVTYKDLLDFCNYWDIPYFQIVVQNESENSFLQYSNAARFVVFDVTCQSRKIKRTIRNYAGKEMVDYPQNNQ